MVSSRLWLVRVAQEFEIEATTADEALAFFEKARLRKIKGAKLTDSKGCLVEGRRPS